MQVPRLEVFFEMFEEDVLVFTRERRSKILGG
jgi:hypothetical protein